MRRRLALYLMFALFGVAYATLDRMPRSVIPLLRGSAEHVLRAEDVELFTGPDA